jgi:hypothetical protein
MQAAARSCLDKMRSKIAQCERAWNYALQHRGPIRRATLIGEAVAVKKLRQIGFGLSANLITTFAMLGCMGFAATAGEPSQYAAALQKIFDDLDAEGVDIPFGGPIAAPLGIALKQGQTVQVHELPPVRTSSLDVVHVFNRLKDGSGYIIIRFTPSGYVAMRFDKTFKFVAAGVQKYGQPAAELSGAAAEDMLSRELNDCEAIASRLAAHP